MRRSMFIGGAVVLFLIITATIASGDTIERRPIVIMNNYEFTVENGVTAGSGTANDPYIIEGWRIDAGSRDYGIHIHRTTRTFVIRNVEISGAAKAGIFLNFVRNASVEDSTLIGNWVGITLSFAGFNRIRGCTIKSNMEGIILRFSDNNQILDNTVTRNAVAAIWFFAAESNEIIGNIISSNHMGIFLDFGSQENLIHRNTFLDNVHNARSVSANSWDKGGAGNYWLDHRAFDSDRDGIWDSPYIIRSDADQDNFPLVHRP